MVNNSKRSGTHRFLSRPFLVPFISVLVVLLLAGTALALASNGSLFQRGYRKHDFKWMLMDTDVTLIIYSRAGGKTVKDAAGKAYEEMKGLEERLSRGVEGSEVWLINEGAGRPVKVSRVTLEVIQKAVHYGEISGGAFDVTIAPLMDIWGFFNHEPGLPSPEEITSAMALVDYRSLNIDPEKSEVTLPPGMKLDLGGIAKGYIVDRGIEVLQGEGIEIALLNAGGDIRTLGKKPDGTPWNIGIRDPRNAETREPLLVLPLRDAAVATSGDYERFFIQDGERYHHILDPHTGSPAGGLISVTIVAADVAAADALSTAVFIMGPEKGMTLVESLDGIEAVMVTPDQSVVISSGLRPLAKSSE